jgi:hypothetical protein
LVLLIVLFFSLVVAHVQSMTEAQFVQFLNASAVMSLKVRGENALRRTEVGTVHI